MQTRRQYILIETLISIAINVALSMGFVFLVFHGTARISATGTHGIVLDMVPQTFMVTLMGTLVPSLLTLHRRAAGKLAWIGLSSGRLSRAWGPAIYLALIASLLVVGMSWLVLPRLIPNGLDFRSLVLAKALFGGWLAAIVTPWAVSRALRQA